MRSLRVPLAVAFFVAALLTMVNVSAYTTATVANSASVTVTTGSTAALALSSTSAMVSGQGQVLLINFEKGYTSTVTPALQLKQTSSPTIAADDFTMLNVFKVTNLSSNDVCATVTTVSAAPAILQSIIGRVGGTSVTLTATAKQFLPKNGGVMNVDFRWHPQTTTPTTNGSFQLQVSGTKSTSGTCP